MMERKLFTGLVIMMLLVGAVPTTVLAQGAPQPVLLDQETTKIGTVSVDNQSYSVYRHENVFPYVSGIEIYTDGSRVTSEATAEEVLTALAQRRAVEELGSDDLSALRTTSQNVSRTAPAVSETATALNETTGYVVDLKTTSEGGTTVYNASVDAAPQLPEFNETARELRPELRSFENDSNAYTSNASALITLLEQRENGTDVDPQRLYDRYAATLEAKEGISNHLGFDGINDQLPVVANLSEAIARNVSTAPEGNETAQQFQVVHNESTVAANRTAALDLSEFEFDQAQERAESLEEDWMEQWESRRNPAREVYQSIGVIGAAIIVGIGYVTWRRR